VNVSEEVKRSPSLRGADRSSRYRTLRRSESFRVHFKPSQQQRDMSGFPISLEVDIEHMASYTTLFAALKRPTI
jgi:hypothetical protein